MPSSTTSPSTWWKTGVCVASELVGAVHPARAHNVDRQRPLEHGAHLHRGGVRAQHDATFAGPDEEGVLHGPGRVIGGDVQGVEVEPLRLDLGALGNLVTHGDEHVLDPLHECGQRVPGAARTSIGGQGDVDGLLDEHPLVALGGQDDLPGLEGALDPGTGLAHALACLGLGCWRQCADLAVGQRQRGPVPSVREPDRLQCIQISGARDGGQGRVPGSSHGLIGQRADLHRVVGLVGGGHGAFRSAGTGNWGATLPASRLWPARRLSAHLARVEPEAEAGVGARQRATHDDGRPYSRPDPTTKRHR